MVLHEVVLERRARERDLCRETIRDFCVSRKRLVSRESFFEFSTMSLLFGLTIDPSHALERGP